jgi:hypothetical protein
MWMVDPKCLCTKHLIGEHGEIHKHRPNFVKGHSIEGRRGQIEPESMGKRHDELAVEMTRRGFSHQSPYVQPDLSAYDLTDFKVTVEKSVLDLKSRCAACCENLDSIKSTAKSPFHEIKTTVV